MSTNGSPLTVNKRTDTLRKSVPSAGHTRSVSVQPYTRSHVPQQPSLNELQSDYINLDGYDTQLGPLTPPPAVLGGVGGSQSRPSSTDWSSRPGTPRSYRNSRPTTPSLQVSQAPSRDASPNGQHADKRDSKRPWFGGGAGKLRKDGKMEERRPVAWIAGNPEHLAYNLDDLVNAVAVKEVWDHIEGNCYVYLFPRDSGKGPSFKVNSAVFASSPVLTRLAFGDLYSNDAVRNSGDRRHMPLDLSLNNITLTDYSSPAPEQHSLSDSSEVHLYLPVKFNNDSHIPTQPSAPPQRGKEGVKDPGMEDLQTMIDIRNFFAFLCGQSLVATERRNSFFSIFMNISSILKTYEFSNLDGSTYGEVASASFDTYVEELSLADVRSSREKTIEGIVLAERMKSVMLYNETFTHGVGKHEDIVAMKSSKFGAVSPLTQNRLDRAAMDLEKRTASVRLILESFEFPALFTGIAASKTSEERKEGVRFDPWKESFYSMRKNVLSFLKHRYGDWPPKAKSKKNNLETSGLNRLVLRDLYQDICSVYDLIVDRTTLTTRTLDGKDLAVDREEANIRALRTLMSESDRSSPPVKPPIPFDLPKIPVSANGSSGHRSGFSLGGGDLLSHSNNSKKRDDRKLKDDDMMRALRSSWNNDAVVTPFLDMYREMEKRAARGCTLSEIVDQRIGHWIFLYVVLQALPMLACDAPALRWTQGVEYFLCEPPRSGVPWSDPTTSRASAMYAGAGAGMQWYTVENNGGGVVSLPADVLTHSVEGIYRRSHAWTAAERWTATDPSLNDALHEQEAATAAAAAAEARDARDLRDSYDSRSDGFGNGNGNSTRVEAGQRISTVPISASASNLLSIPSAPSSRSSSPGAAMRTYPYQQKRHSSLGLGLEALPLPAGVSPDGYIGYATTTGAARSDSPGSGSGYDRAFDASSSASAGTAARPRSFQPGVAHAAPPVDKAKTFDAILANVGAEDGRAHQRGRKGAGAAGKKK